MTIQNDAKPTVHWGRIARDGLWSNNVILGQLLALCPTMAVTGTATNGLGMGLATTAVLTVSNMLVAAIRQSPSPRTVSTGPPPRRRTMARDAGRRRTTASSPTVSTDTEVQPGPALQARRRAISVL